MRESTLLEIDGVGNLALGLVFLLAPGWVAELLGLPGGKSGFYPVVLGAVLFGIGVALLLERFRDRLRVSGLGLAGAMSINLCFGIVLAGWLALGETELSGRGRLLLWLLVAVLVGISGFELASQRAWRSGSG